jgi:hypothetical protein
MKRIKSALICGLVLAFAGVSTLVVAEGAKMAATATVRSVHGTATYSVNGGGAMPLRPNMELTEGTTIVTGPDTTVDVQVNGKASTVRITANTTMNLKTMQDLGAGDSETMLDLKNGLILGSVKKISKDSHYEVNTPRGVAGIRGTDFEAIVTVNPDGSVTITIGSITGTVVAVAKVIIGGVPQTVSKTLTSGQQWTFPPGTLPAGSPIDLTPTAIPGPVLLNVPGGPPQIVNPTGPTTTVFVPPIPSNPSSNGGSGNSSSQQGGGGSQSED